jgi:hypothetical protein
MQMQNFAFSATYLHTVIYKKQKVNRCIITVFRRFSVAQILKNAENYAGRFMPALKHYLIFFRLLQSFAKLVIDV